MVGGITRSGCAYGSSTLVPRLFKGRLAGTDGCMKNPVSEEPLLLVRHYPHRAWSVAGIFHMREVSMSHEG